MTLKQWLDSFNTPGVSISGASDATTYLPPNTALVRELTDAYYRDQAHKAEDAFHKAFLRLQGELPTINENGTIEYRDGRKGTYALNEDIQDAILPFLQQYGFTLHFETANPMLVGTVDGAIHAATMSVTGVLTHRRGHQRRSTFDAPADLSGGKTVGQARGSIMSYAHRYCTIDLLNLVTRGVDTDGTGFRFGFDPAVLDDHAKPVFRHLVEAACDGTLEECWKALDTSDRASVGFECFNYVKQLAGYVR